MNNLKLTMNDEYSFQKMMGYHDDPEAMTIDEVRPEISHWANIVGRMLDGENLNADCLNGLDGFLSSLSQADIEYEHPLTEYGYHIGIELCSDFTIYARSQDEADEKAKIEFERANNWLHGVKVDHPFWSSVFTGEFKYLERTDNDCKRIIED